MYKYLISIIEENLLHDLYYYYNFISEKLYYCITSYYIQSIIYYGVYKHETKIPFVHEITC